MANKNLDDNIILRETYLYKESHVNHQCGNYANYQPQNPISNSRRTNIHINLQTYEPT